MKDEIFKEMERIKCLTENYLWDLIATVKIDPEYLKNENTTRSRAQYSLLGNVLVRIVVSFIINDPKSTYDDNWKTAIEFVNGIEDLLKGRRLREMAEFIDSKEVNKSCLKN